MVFALVFVLSLPLDTDVELMENSAPNEAEMGKAASSNRRNQYSTTIENTYI